VRVGTLQLPFRTGSRATSRLVQCPDSFFSSVCIHLSPNLSGPLLCSVGKTSLLERFVKNRFSQQYKATIGADFYTKDMVVDGVVISAQFWDTGA
jgi:Ras family